MASKKRKRTSDQSDKPARAKSRHTIVVPESGKGTGTVAQLEEKEVEIFQKPAAASGPRKRGRPRKDSNAVKEKPSKKPTASSSSTTASSPPSTRAPSDLRKQDLRRSKRNTRSSPHPTIAARALSPQVEPTPHSQSSLQHYKYFSQVEPTQSSPARSQARSLRSSQSSSASSFRVTGEVPDTESEPEDESDDPSASFRYTSQTEFLSSSSEVDNSGVFTHEVRVHRSLYILLVR